MQLVRSRRKQWTHMVALYGLAMLFAVPTLATPPAMQVTQDKDPKHHVKKTSPLPSKQQEILWSVANPDPGSSAVECDGASTQHSRNTSWMQHSASKAYAATEVARHSSIVDAKVAKRQIQIFRTGKNVKAREGNTTVGGKHTEKWPPDALKAAPMPDIDAMVTAAGITTDKPFLFIGVLSSRRTYRRRVTVRNTWAHFITHMQTDTIQLRFVLARDEVYTDNGVTEDNVLYVKSATVTYSSILIKVFVMLEYATSIGARWLLKTDDDAFVNIPQTVQNLLTLCTTAACDSERAYVGTMVGGSGVYMDQRHKWHNAEYLEHTMVQTYLPYALGGGYILSLDVIKVLVELHQKVGLLFTSIEDANVGMWLAGMNVSLVNWNGPMVTAGWTCCFTRTHREKRNEILGRYTLSADPCQPKTAGTKILMDKEALEKLRYASSKEQTETSGQATDLGASDDSDDLLGGGTGTDVHGIGGQGRRLWRRNARALSSESPKTVEPHLLVGDAQVVISKAASVHMANKDGKAGMGAASVQDGPREAFAASMPALIDYIQDAVPAFLRGRATRGSWRLLLLGDRLERNEGQQQSGQREVAEGKEERTSVVPEQAHDEAAGVSKPNAMLGDGVDLQVLAGAGPDKQATEKLAEDSTEEDKNGKADELERLQKNIDGLQAKSISEYGWTRQIPGSRHQVHDSTSERLVSDEVVTPVALHPPTMPRPGAQSGSAGTRSGGLELLKAPPFERIPRRNSSAPGASFGASVIYTDVFEEETASAGSSQVWRTRPMILHKVANPLHLYYLQWRLTHCSIPQADLLSDDAIASAASVIPSTADIFHVSHALFAHGARGGRAVVRGKDL